MSKATVTVIDNRTGKGTELPIQESTYGEAVIDISGLPKELGYFTFDPGFVATAVAAAPSHSSTVPKGS